MCLLLCTTSTAVRLGLRGCEQHMATTILDRDGVTGNARQYQCRANPHREVGISYHLYDILSGSDQLVNYS